MLARRALSSFSTASNSNDVLSLAKQYCDWDPNTTTRSYVLGLLSSPSSSLLLSDAALCRSLTTRLSFGTAGLRAPFGAGFANMNDLTVLQTAQGLLKHLSSTLSLPTLRSRGVVIGYDHRSATSPSPFSLSSSRFAELTAAAFAHHDVPVYLFPLFVATPIVPFAVTQLNAAAGVCVTASHNPKEDAGYKVYWGNGAQIIPPHDVNIAKAIKDNLVPWLDYSKITQQNVRDISKPTDHLPDLYFEKVASELCNHKSSNVVSPLSITYTAMHGVGHPYTLRSFSAFSLPPFHSVPLQQVPDPAFPTVPFPNPEEGAGALSLAMQHADKTKSTLILANDPDADRLAVAERRDEPKDAA